MMVVANHYWSICSCKRYNQRTITDLDGKLTSINARNNDVLIFSYVGMNTQDIKVNNQRFISVTMKDDVASLDEVVCCGIRYSKTWKHHCSNFYRIGQSNC